MREVESMAGQGVVAQLTALIRTTAAEQTTQFQAAIAELAASTPDDERATRLGRKAVGADLDVSFPAARDIGRDTHHAADDPAAAGLTAPTAAIALLDPDRTASRTTGTSGLPSKKRRMSSAGRRGPGWLPEPSTG